MSTTNYEAAPATELVATHCAACGRPLLDAVSVECGMGPVCRERAGLSSEGTGADWPRVVALLAGSGVDLSTADARKAANRIVARIAAAQQSEGVPALLGALEALGFAAVAEAIRTHLKMRVPTVSVAVEGDRFTVTVADLDRETFGAVVAALRGVPGRWFDGDRKVNVVPSRARVQLWRALNAALPAGAHVVGPKGVSVVTH